MPRFSLCSRLALTGLALLLAPSGGAQTTVSVLGGMARFTGDGGPAPVAGAAVTVALSPRFDVDVMAEVAGSSETSDAALLAPTPTEWNTRQHALAAAGATAYPVRAELGGATHRVGLAGGLVVRRRDDDLHHLTFSPAFFAERPASRMAETAAAWAANGEGFTSRVLRTEEGEHLALTYRERKTEVGNTIGAVYEVAVGRAVVGVRGDFRWLLGQRVTSGTQALDLTARVGVRL
ncbi:hypothetical protein [Rubrivirga sp. IMCC45206]|uniref:hypothetical protein n=1 Tax=Rubrivirga sp. IMCC45206 TaxID=3391614 RepID=UPI003990362A